MASRKSAMASKRNPCPARSTASEKVFAARSDFVPRGPAAPRFAPAFDGPAPEAEVDDRFGVVRAALVRAVVSDFVLALLRVPDPAPGLFRRVVDDAALARVAPVRFDVPFEPVRVAVAVFFFRADERADDRVVFLLAMVGDPSGAAPARLSRSEAARAVRW